ncbi:MAG: hypothetical protein IT306_24455 [Chloroflexi bacterium]|nr:hypothetical protein [Chloroflexota bacterium]
MADCACTNFPAGLGNVTIGASLGVGGSVPAGGLRLDVQGGGTRLKSSNQFPLLLDAGNASIPFSSVIQFRKSDGTSAWQFGSGAYQGTQQEFGLLDVIAGSWRLYVGPTGNVGVGTPTPAKRLHVQTSTPDSHIYAADTSPSVQLGNHATSPGSSTMNTILAMATVNGHYGLSAGDALIGMNGSGHGSLHVNSNYQGGSTSVIMQPGTGNVGVGTTAPAKKLHVQAATPNGQLFLSDTSPSIDMGNNASGASTMGAILALATVTGHYGLTAGDAMLALQGSLHGNLYINSNYTAGSTSVVLQPSTGNVGIGTGTSSPPSYKLDVQGSTRLKSGDQFPLLLDAGNASIPFSSVIQFRKIDGTPAWQFGSGAYLGTQQEFGLLDVIAGSWRLYVGPTGNVGIGQTAPQARLHVGPGGIRSDGGVTADGPISTSTLSQADISSGGDVRAARNFIASGRTVADGNGCYYA